MPDARLQLLMLLTERLCRVHHFQHVGSVWPNDLHSLSQCPLVNTPVSILLISRIYLIVIKFHVLNQMLNDQFIDRGSVINIPKSDQFKKHKGLGWNDHIAFLLRFLSTVVSIPC